MDTLIKEKTKRLIVTIFINIFVFSFSLEGAKKKNVLLILVDDLKPALGCYGDPLAITPNMDKLADRGIRFDLAFCNQSVCAPSRFALMLGSHSTSTGLYGLGNHLRKTIPDAVTIPQHFAKYGYKTESLGKIFHIGHGNYGDPDSFSVPHFHDKVIEYLDPKSTDGGQLTREEAYFTNQKLGQIRSLPRGAAYEAPDVKDDAYADGRVATETIKRIKAAKQSKDPFFMAVGFARPHLPFSAPKKYWDMHKPEKFKIEKITKLPIGSPKVAGKRGGEISNYKPVPTDRNAEISESLQLSLIHGYYASVTYADAQIGRVLNALDQFELTSETIIVLWGDHGFHLGDLGIWTKHTNYEQANRIPIIISAPGQCIPGSATKQPMESVDIFPTLNELAGIPPIKGPQAIDGLSMVDVLKDPKKRIRNHAYHAYPRAKMGRAIRTEKYRLVEWSKPGTPTEYELYDYSNDSIESKNFYSKLPKVANRLKTILKKYPKPKRRK